MTPNPNPQKLDPATVIWREQFQAFMEYRLDELKQLFLDHEDKGGTARKATEDTLADHEKRLARLETLWRLLTIIWGLLTAIIIPIAVATILQLLNLR